MKRLQILAFALMLGSALAHAGERTTPQAIRDVVRSFLTREAVGLPGLVETSVGQVDDRVILPACAQMQVSLPPGGRLWGNGSVAVRCTGASTWTIYVPVEVKVTGSYLVAARPLAAGQPLLPADVTSRTGELTRMPAGIVLDPTQLNGKVLAYGLPGGEPLRADMLRAPLTVQSNQPVRLVTRGAGFVVSAEGRALSNGGDGQTVQVRTPSGQVVAGVVRPGPVVEVAY